MYVHKQQLRPYLAESSIALEVFRALLVAAALDGLPDAADYGRRVGREPGPAGAGGPLVQGLAGRVGPAGDARAGVLALVIDAGERGRAVGVLAAPDQAHLVQTNVAQEAVIVNAASH